MPIILIGYAGHAFVAADIFLRNGVELLGYCDHEEKELNPYNLPYLGSEDSEGARALLDEHYWFVSIGDNRIRSRVYEKLETHTRGFGTNAIHPTAVIASSVEMEEGVMVAAGAVLNPLARIGFGVICNTGCIIEHECIIGDFAHIAPGAVLAGNVTVGDGAFVGANAVVKQGVQIGRDAVVGAGAVVLRDVPAGQTVVGNPARIKEV